MKNTLTQIPKLFFLAIIFSSVTCLAAQYGRPAGTVSTGTWTANGAATLHEAMDEVTANGDTDYTEALSNSTFEVSLSSLLDPLDDTNHIINMNVFTTANQTKVSVALYQGGTLIGTLAAVASNGSYSTKTYTLLTSESANITNYSDLRVQVTVTGTGGPQNNYARVTQLELVIPDLAATPATLSNPTVSNVNQNSATLGATVDSEGSSAVVERGTVWNTTGTPTVADTKVIEGGTGTGTYSHAVTGLPTGTLIYFCGYATNSSGPAYSPESTFWTEPGTPPSAINFTGIDTTSMTINWTPGQGDSIVVLKQGTAVDSNPIDGTTYTANTVFGSGSQLGTGNFVLFIGNGTSVTVTNLIEDTLYHVAIYAYSGSGSAINYLEGQPAVSSEQTTQVITTEPAVSTPVSSTITATTSTLGATIDNDGGDPILERGIVWNTSGSPVIPEGQNVEGLTALGSFTTGVTGLPSGVLIYFRGYATNATGTGYSADGTFYTEPGTPPSAINFTSIDTTSMTINWTPGQGDSIVVLKQGTVVDSNPVDGSTYTGSTIFGSGSQLGTGNFVLFIGNGASVTVTNLIADTLYHVAVYAYSGSGAAINYLESQPAVSSEQTTPAASTEPTVSTPVSSSVTTTNATLGATIDNDGGDPILERGIVWNTSGSPVIPEGQNVEGLTALGSFTTAVTGLPSGTLIYFRGYATNATGTGYSADGTFYTEPGTQASGVGFSNATATSVDVTWTPGTGDGSIVIVKADSAVDVDPLDLTEYIGNPIFMSGEHLGSSNYVVYKGSGSTFNLQGLSGGTTYHVAVYAYVGAGTGSDGVNYRHFGGPARGNEAIIGGGPPTLSAPTVAQYPGQTTATLGATIDGDGGATLNERGIVWNLIGDPSTADNKVAASGPPVVGAFTVDVDPLPASSMIYFKGYATNTSATGYSSQQIFYTEPTVSPSGVSFPSIQSYSLELGWTRGNGDGVIVIMREGSAVNASPVDWVEYASTGYFGTGDVLNIDNYVVYSGPAAGITVSGLSGDTTYHVAIFEYKGTGTGTGGINYLNVSAIGNQATSAVNGHNASYGIQCDQCHALHSSPIPRGAVQEAVCATCHNPTGAASAKSDVSLHNSSVDCGACHDLHNNQSVFNATDPHAGGINADNVDWLRTNIGKYISVGVEPLIFQQSHKDNKEYTYDTTAPDGKMHGACQACHTTTKYYRNDNTGIAHPDPGGLTCDQCHSHATGFQPDVTNTPCIDCHNTPTTDRRAIFPEFALSSHHISGSGTDADCMVCHMEPAEFHNDGKVDLRDPDTGLALPALPSLPLTITRDRSSNILETEILDLQNNFCFKCHDADGATAAYTQSTGTALQPFSTGTDVVNIFDSMDPANTSHHAVRAAGSNPYCSPTATNELIATMVSPWNQSTDEHNMITCFDCHELNGHGSSNQRILLDPIDFTTMESVTAKADLPSGMGLTVEAFCTRCHVVSTYVSVPSKTPFGSIFEFHGDLQSQHGASGGNDLGCMGCHGGVVNLSTLTDANTNYDGDGTRGSVHGDTWLFPPDSNTPGLPAERFIYGGWTNSWQSTDKGYCNGGQCNHSGNFKSYTKTSIDY